jgi:hydroxyacylglutathione hydrolase
MTSNPSHFTTECGSRTAIRAIPVLDDNYIFVVHDKGGSKALVVDPAVGQPVLDAVQESGHHLQAILNTHHHGDHVGANRWLSERVADLKIFAHTKDAHRIPGLTDPVSDGTNLEFFGRRVLVKETPGHTLGHIVYLFEPESPGDAPDLFVGDTLFGGGCGKLFEGSHAQMLASLQWIRALPGNTRVWCAHEYTKKNYEVACQLEPKNKGLREHLEKIIRLRHLNQPTIPLTLGDEMRWNPFLRWDDPMLAKTTQTTTPLETFTAVRDFRDQF